MVASLRCLLWSLWIDALLSLFPQHPRSPTPPHNCLLGGLRGQKLKVGASIGLRACAQRNSSHSSEGRFHAVNSNSTSSTYLKWLGLELGQRWSSPLQRMDRNLQSPRIPVYLVVSIPGRWQCSARHECFRCDSSSHTVPCSLTHCIAY
jgi:hypothetical protein